MVAQSSVDASLTITARLAFGGVCVELVLELVELAAELGSPALAEPPPLHAATSIAATATGKNRDWLNITENLLELTIISGARTLAPSMSSQRSIDERVDRSLGAGSVNGERGSERRRARAEKAAFCLRTQTMRRALERVANE
jgi:hypothetical protein